MGYNKKTRDCRYCSGSGMVPLGSVNGVYCGCIYGLVKNLSKLLGFEPKERDDTLIFDIRERIKKISIKNLDVNLYQKE